MNNELASQCNGHPNRSDCRKCRGRGTTHHIVMSCCNGTRTEDHDSKPCFAFNAPCDMVFTEWQESRLCSCEFGQCTEC